MPQLSSYYQKELTLPDILRRAAIAPDKPYVGFLNDAGGEDFLTYAELLKEAELIATGLWKEGVVQSDKVIIATESNRETLILLWGCFLLGVVPTVLQPPPTFSGYNPPVVKLAKVYEQLNEPLVFMSKLPDSPDAPEFRYKTVAELETTGVMPKVSIDPGSVAFIQFSSGSTGDPKGIMLTHHNIMVNLDAIRIGLDFHPTEVTGNWMPLFHDMGLIGYHLTPLYCSIYQWHIETIDFIKNPGLWLDLLTRQKVKITGCPNFGLALTLRFIKRMKNRPLWDFSSLQAILNGAEPISVQIMTDFIKELEPHNFRREAMMPVYGLAEATLAATFTPLMTPPVITAFDALILDRDHKAVEIEIQAGNVTDRNAGTGIITETGSIGFKAEGSDIGNYAVRLISGVGVPLNDISIKITDSEFNEVPEGTAGLISIKGESVTQGYYNRPEESKQVFRDGWFNTGDIGFLYKGNYYVSGRHKDIIFKNGRHYFANDLEELACNIEGISYGKICFAGITNHNTGQEEVIAFLAGSAGPKAEETFVQMRNLLRSTLGITPDHLVMVRSNEIPKTSSGKLQRYKLLQRYLGGEFAQATVISDK